MIYIQGKNNEVADALSRAPSNEIVQNLCVEMYIDNLSGMNLDYVNLKNLHALYNR